MLKKFHSDKSLNNSRLKIVLYGYYIVLSFIVLRLFQIQVIQHKKYSYAAQQQHWGQFEIDAIRGNIFSVDNSLLAGTQDYYLMYGEPNRVEDPKFTARKLAQYFAEIDYQEQAKQSSASLPQKTQGQLEDTYYQRFLENLSKSLLWVPLKHNISPLQKEVLADLNLVGIGFQVEPIRYYPESTMASHVLGFVASDETGEKRGYFGIEGAFNENLKGRKGRVAQEVDAMGTPLLIGGIKEVPAIQGSTMYLTIDRSVQYMVEKALKEGVEKFDAKSGTVVVMDPFTGSIIALANYPTYMPSDFSEEPVIDEKVYRKPLEKRNLAIAETYEPGSIMKPLTVAAAIDLGIVNENTTFVDNGPVEYSGKWIDNWDGKHHSLQTITQLLQKSNNIGAAWVGHQVGSKQIYTYFENFGLGQLTHVDLEGEDTGILRDYNNWTDIDLANISFGQGISATPLQMLNAINALANGGFLLQPRIVSHMIDNSKQIEMPTKVIRRVISKETSDTMVTLLEKAAEGGEAKYFILKNYRISGKTGTAQIPIEGKYDPLKTNASFVGFLTGSKKFSMIVKLEQPRTSVFAAETAVPLWMDITSELIKHYGLSPDKQTSDQPN